MQRCQRVTGVGDLEKTFLLVALVLALVVCTLHHAKATAEAVTVKPTPIRPQTPLYEQERIVPCLDRRAPVALHEFYLEGPGGQRIPVGYDAIRKRC